MYELARALINEKYGSINKLSKVIGVENGILYAGFKGTKPLFPKYKRLIAEALGTGERIFETEIDLADYEKEKAVWERRRVGYMINKYAKK